MKKNFFGLIMGGGQGTRFWPWSTEKKPKQFLNIIGDDPLITQTFNRLKKFIKTENILQHMTDPILREKRRRGLLKTEQLHQLSREVSGCT